MFGLSKRTLTVIGIAAAVLALYLLGSGEQPQAGTDTAANPSECRVTVTADVLNVRAAPALDAPVVGKIRQNDETDAEQTVQNGFRKLAENRWAADEFLAPKRGHNCAAPDQQSG